MNEKPTELEATRNCFQELLLLQSHHCSYARNWQILEDCCTIFKKRIRVLEIKERALTSNLRDEQEESEAPLDGTEV